MRNGIKNTKCTGHPFITFGSRGMLGIGSITLFIALTFLAESSAAQQIAPIPGTPPVPDIHAKYHMGPLGKPCLTIAGYAKPETVNKNIYQHWISAANNCGQIVRVRICYFETEDCIVMSVPPWDRKESVLGIFPALKRFKFEAKEQF
jgi:hypothetical protein